MTTQVDERVRSALLDAASVLRLVEAGDRAGARALLATYTGPEDIAELFNAMASLAREAFRQLARNAGVLPLDLIDAAVGVMRD